MKRLWRAKHVLIALGLLLANGLGWWNAVASMNLVEVEPRLSQPMQAMWEKMRSGTAAGESFAITINEQEAAEGVAWFLANHPAVPFSHPQVEVSPEGLTGRGLAHMFGLRTPAYGKGRVGLRDGLPTVEVTEIGVAGLVLPPWMIDAIQGELETPLDFRRYNLPFYLTRLELRDGEIYGEGVYR